MWPFSDAVVDPDPTAVYLHAAALLLGGSRVLHAQEVDEREPAGPARLEGEDGL